MTEMKLELAPVPVSDVDRAKAFYADQAGFTVDADVQPAEVSGSFSSRHLAACSIVLSTGLPELEDMPPGSMRGLHLVVADVRKAGDELSGRGVEVGDVEVHDQGIKYVWFSDPDGNTWALQKMPWRAADFDTSLDRS